MTMRFKFYNCHAFNTAIIRFMVFESKIKRLFKYWVTVGLMGALSHFQQYFSSVVVRVFATGGNNIVMCLIV